MKASLTVFFEEPFWVGVFERIEDGKLSVCKVTFGAEPKDYEVWDYILHLDMETMNIVDMQMYIDGYQVKLVSDTSYWSLWEESFTLKEF